MVDWIRKTGTTAHPLTVVLSDANGPFNFPVGSTVTIRAKIPGALVPKINAPATIVDPGALPGAVDIGRVQYTFLATDLDTPGLYEVDFLANVPGIGQQVFPESSGYGVYMTLLVVRGADTV